MPKDSAESRSYFGIREEYIALGLIAPLIFACMVTDPILVSIENFNNGQPSVLLNYAGGDNQSFELNISKYVSRGNWTSDGVFRNFTLRICPTAGSPSNIRLYLPETADPVLLHGGVLAGCQDVSVDTLGLDSYFNTTTALIINFPVLVSAAGGGSIPDANSVMLRHPKIYDSAEEVTYTLLWPYLQADEVRYRCTPSGTVLSSTSPAADWSLSFDIPAGIPVPPLPPMPIPLPFNGNTLNASATLWDLPCPAYGAPGKYQGEVTGVHIYIDDSQWPDFVNITDDFNTSSFNTAYWEVHTVNASMPSENRSVLRLESPLIATGVNAYYSQPVTPNSTQRFNITLELESMDIQGDVGAVAAGVIGFFNSTSEPTTQALIAANLSNILAFNESAVMLLCDPMAGPVAMGALGPSPNFFTISSNGSNISYYVNGAFLGNCSGVNGINDTVYYMFSPDAITDGWIGNFSVDSANITYENWDGGAWVPFVDYDDNFSSLNLTAWTMLNNTAVGGSSYHIYSYMYNPSGVAYYINNWTGSELELVSYAPDDGSGIVAYYTDPVRISGAAFSGFLMNASANRSGYQGSGMAGFFLSTLKQPPGNSSSFLPNTRAAIFYNQTDYLMFCDISQPGPPNVTGTFTPMDPEFVAMGYDSISGNMVLFVGHDMLTTCGMPGETLYFGFTSDPFTDFFNGNMSFDRVELASVNLYNVTGWRWFEPASPVWDLVSLIIGTPFTFDFTSDVIVRDCTNPWNCPYTFQMSSDTAGGVNVSILNITYENLLGYESGMPTVTLQNSDIFSWMAKNSTIVNSDVRYQSSIYDSTITNSEVIFSDLRCVDVTDSTVEAVSRLDGFDNESFGDSVPIAIPSLVLAPEKCGEIDNSRITGGLMLGGSAYDSDIIGGVGLFMDYYDADFQNLILRDGTIVMNVTKYGANVRQWMTAMGMDNSSLDISVLFGLLGGTAPFGCDESAVFAIEGFPQARIADSNTSFSCWIQLYDIHMIFDNVEVTNSSVGGPVISLDDAAFTIGNQSQPFNLVMREDEAYLKFWNLTPGAGITFNSSQQYVQDDLLALNGSYYDWTNGTVITVAFTNLPFAPATIYRYPGFTDDHDLIVQNGTPCNDSNFCYNITWDQAAHVLMFNVTNFSSYAITRPTVIPPGPNNPSSSFTITVDAGRVSENTLFTTMRSPTSPLPLVEIRVLGPNSPSLLVDILTTDDDGEATFVPVSPGTYYYRASRAGYDNMEGSFYVAAADDGGDEEPEPEERDECAEDSDCAESQECSGGRCVDLEAGECGSFENHAWVPYACCADSDCSEGQRCEGHECVDIPPEVEPEIEESPQVPPSTTPQEQPAEPIMGQVEEIQQPTPTECCLLGLCGTFAGLCWYWWPVIFVILLLVLAAVIGYNKITKRGKK